MKAVAILLLTIFLCFPVLNGFGEDADVQNTQNYQADYLIPFTSEIFDLLYGAVVYLERLDYYLSAPVGIVLEPQPKQEDVLRIANGALFFDQSAIGEALPEIIVNGDSCGQLKSFFGTQKGSEIFEIEFGTAEKKSLLQFRRNAQNDLFELFSMFDVSAEKNYLLRSDSIVPYLLIRSDRSGVIRMSSPVTQTPQSAPTLALPPQLPSSSQPLLSFPIQGASAYTAPDYIPPPAVSPSANAAKSDAQPASPQVTSPSQVSLRNDIMKSGSLSKNSVVAFVRSRNSAVDTALLNALVDAYIAEAGSEQVNHDIAVAQMCYATNYLRNQDRMLVHDYAALGRPLNRTGDNSRDMVKGVRAHIQHLKGYASAENPRQAIEDPRFEVIIRTGIRGKITTFDELYARWAPLSPNYGANINGIMREMARF